MNIKTSDFTKYEKYSQITRRELILHHTFRKYLSQNISVNKNKKVSIISPTNKSIYMKNIFLNYNRQLYPNKELIIILNNNKLNMKKWQKYSKNYQNVNIYQLDESITLGKCINYAVKKASGSYIAKFDDDDYYSINYLRDIIYSFSLVNVSVIGKCSHFVFFEKTGELYLCFPDSSYKYSSEIAGGTHVIKREVFEKVRFPDLNVGEDKKFNKDCIGVGLKLYTTDPFNYLRIRRADKNYHTWKINDKDYTEKWCSFIKKTDMPEKFVSI